MAFSLWKREVDHTAGGWPIVLCLSVPTPLHPPPSRIILPPHGPTNLPPNRRCRRSHTCSLTKWVSGEHQSKQQRPQPHPERNRETSRRIRAALAALDSPALDC